VLFRLLYRHQSGRIGRYLVGLIAGGRWMAAILADKKQRELTRDGGASDKRETLNFASHPGRSHWLHDGHLLRERF
jgi:hypothetical protein